MVEEQRREQACIKGPRVQALGGTLCRLQWAVISPLREYIQFSYELENSCIFWENHAKSTPKVFRATCFIYHNHNQNCKLLPQQGSLLCGQKKYWGGGRVDNRLWRGERKDWDLKTFEQDCQGEHFLQLFFLFSHFCSRWLNCCYVLYLKTAQYRPLQLSTAQLQPLHPAILVNVVTSVDLSSLSETA